MVRVFFLFKVWHFNFNIFGKQAANAFRKNKAIVRFAASEQSEGSPQWFQERPRIDRSSEWHFKAKRRVVILWTEWMKQQQQAELAMLHRCEATPAWADVSGNAACIRKNVFFGVRLWASHHQWDVENASLYSHVLPAIFIKHMLVIWKTKRGKKRHEHDIRMRLPDSSTQETNKLPGLCKLFRQGIRKAQSRQLMNSSNYADANHETQSCNLTHLIYGWQLNHWHQHPPLCVPLHYHSAIFFTTTIFNH